MLWNQVISWGPGLFSGALAVSFKGHVDVVTLVRVKFYDLEPFGMLVRGSFLEDMEPWAAMCSIKIVVLFPLSNDENRQKNNNKKTACFFHSNALVRRFFFQNL